MPLNRALGKCKCVPWVYSCAWLSKQIRMREFFIREFREGARIIGERGLELRTPNLESRIENKHFFQGGACCVMRAA